MFERDRFVRLARAQLAEQWRGWAWFLGVGVIVHFVVVLLQLAPAGGYARFSGNHQSSLYFAGLFITGPIFAARYFQGMSRPESAVTLLMRPASPFEKWLLAAGIVLVAYPLAYSLVFQVCNVPAALYAEVALRHAIASAQADAWVLTLDPADFGVLMPWEAYDGWREVVGVWLWLACLQGFALLGSLYFRVMPFILTLVSGFLLLLLLILLVEVTGARPDTFLGWWMDDRVRQGWSSVAMPLAWLLVPGLLWLAALFALREREVA